MNLTNYVIRSTDGSQNSFDVATKHKGQIFFSWIEFDTREEAEDFAGTLPIPSDDAEERAQDWMLIPTDTLDRFKLLGPGARAAVRQLFRQEETLLRAQLKAELRCRRGGTGTSLDLKPYDWIAKYDDRYWISNRLFKTPEDAQAWLDSLDMRVDYPGHPDGFRGVGWYEVARKGFEDMVRNYPASLRKTTVAAGVLQIMDRLDGIEPAIKEPTKLELEALF